MTEPTTDAKERAAALAALDIVYSSHDPQPEAYAVVEAFINRASLPPPAGEPVAWGVKTGKRRYRGPDEFYDIANTKAEAEAVANQALGDYVVPLYDAPPAAPGERERALVNAMAHAESDLRWLANGAASDHRASMLNVANALSRAASPPAAPSEACQTCESPRPDLFRAGDCYGPLMGRCTNQWHARRDEPTTTEGA